MPIQRLRLGTTATWAILGSLLLAGCQSSPPPLPPSAAMDVPGRTVVVSGGNGGGTTVFLPAADGRDPVVFCSTGTEVCPECKAAAAKYFQTGVLDPKCSRSGATRTIAPLVTPNVGHN